MAFVHLDIARLSKINYETSLADCSHVFSDATVIPPPPKPFAAPMPFTHSAFVCFPMLPTNVNEEEPYSSCESCNKGGTYSEEESKTPAANTTHSNKIFLVSKVI